MIHNQSSLSAQSVYSGTDQSHYRNYQYLHATAHAPSSSALTPRNPYDSQLYGYDSSLDLDQGFNRLHGQNQVPSEFVVSSATDPSLNATSGAERPQSHANRE